MTTIREFFDDMIGLVRVFGIRAPVVVWWVFVYYWCEWWGSVLRNWSRRAGDHLSDMEVWYWLDERESKK